jgi:hypothetical protein
MPVQHIILVKFKAGVTETQLNALYESALALAKIGGVVSVNAGENFSSRAQGFDFGVVFVLNDLKAFSDDAAYVAFRDQLLRPLSAAEPVVVDFEYPRSVAKHVLGKEVATPEMQRWDTARCNDDIQITQNTITTKGDAPVWRMAVAARPVRDHGYVDFVIENNPKPSFRGVQIGIVGREDLVNIKEAGKNFTDLAHGVAWQCNGGFILGANMTTEASVPHKEWEHDSIVGIYVDLHKQVVQFFLNRKKIGPALHLKELPNEVFFAVGINTGLVSVAGKWTASCPKVFIA